MGIVSYAQNFEDVLLNRIFAGVHYAFYVDIGAYHPVSDSVTKSFYDRGWDGINVEPGEIFDELAAGRPRDINLHMAVYDRKGEIAFAQHPGWFAGLSHVQEAAPTDAASGVTSRMVPCDTLANILEAHGGGRPIAFLKIDAEGAEQAIIESTDWRAVRPTVLVIEATRPRSNQLDNQHWEPILLEQGYQRAYFDGINCFYVAEERADLLIHFATPVNILDGFQLYNPDLIACRDQVEAERVRVAAVTAELVKLSGDNMRYFEQEAVLRRQLNEAAEQHAAARQNADAAFQEQKALLNSILASQQMVQQSHQDIVTNLHARHTAALHERDHFAAALAQSEARERAFVAQSTAHEYALREQATARERALLDQVEQRQALLRQEAARLHRLVRELRWPEGPGALRTVLPLARALRRLRGTPVPGILPEEASIAALDPPASAASPLAAYPVLAAPPPRPRRSPAKQFLTLAYAPIRPLIRPIAWRTRTFLTGNIFAEMAQIDHKVRLVLTHIDLAAARDLTILQSDLHRLEQRLAQRLDHEQRVEHRLDVLSATLTPLVTTGTDVGPLAVEIRQLQADARQFGRMLESTLLTLALEGR